MVLGCKITFTDLESADTVKRADTPEDGNAQKHDSHFCSGNREQFRKAAVLGDRQNGIRTKFFVFREDGAIKFKIPLTVVSGMR